MLLVSGSQHAWSQGLGRSTLFWAGALSEGQVSPSCLESARANTRSFSSRLWAASVNLGQVANEAIAALELRLRAQRKEVTACQPDSKEDNLEQQLLFRLLDSYREAIEGLKANDVTRLRRAMDQEQQAASRAARCRREYAAGDPSEECLP